MKKIHFETVIIASPEKVWQSIVDKQLYEQWTQVFQEGSTFEGGWNKGDSIKFMSMNKDGQPEGMISEIAESQPGKFLSIHHLGLLLDGVADTTSDEAKKWSGSYENYTFEPVGEGTKFSVDLNVPDEFGDMFSEMWPEALEKLKEVSERN